MALQPSVAPTQPTAAVAAPNRVGAGGRLSSGDLVEGASGSPFVSLTNQWRAANEQNSGAGQGGINQWLRGSSGQPILFTPLVSLAAATYPANAGVQIDSGAAPFMLQTDLQYGVSVYEYNMRVTSGSARNQGSVVNRFS